MPITGGGREPKTEGGRRALKIAVIIGTPIEIAFIIYAFIVGGPL